MVIGSRLRRFGVVADLSLSGAVYNNWPFESIPHHHIIVSNFDYLLGNTAAHIFTFWNGLLHLLLAICRIAL
jgi:hypothetical protein